MDVTYELTERYGIFALYLHTPPRATYITAIYRSSLGLFHVVHNLPLTLTRCAYEGRKTWT